MTEPKRDIGPEQVMEVFGDDPIAEPVAAKAEAPYGYKPDGTPYQRRHGPRGTRAGGASPRRGKTTGSLKTQIGGMLVFVNMPITILSAKNALDSVEIDALAAAIDDECQRNARFRKYVEQMLAVQGGTSLLFVAVAIAGRRVVRNNLVDVPAEIGGNEAADAMIGGIISMMSGNGPINPNLRVMTQQDA